MQTFKDGTGKIYCIFLNVNTFKKLLAYCKKELDEDLLKPCEFLTRFHGSFLFAARVIYFAVLASRSTEDSFQDYESSFEIGLHGETLFEACEAFEEEYINFFPNPEVRESLREMKRAAEKITAQTRARISEQLESIVIREANDDSDSSKESSGEQELAD